MLKLKKASVTSRFSASENSIVRTFFCHSKPVVTTLLYANMFKSKRIQANPAGRMLWALNSHQQCELSDSLGIPSHIHAFIYHCAK